ncbi:MAG: GNAT family N-acetyltransferase [bacterium]
MIKIRRATEQDKPKVIELLKDPFLDLYYDKLEYKDFWVAVKNNNIIGCVQLEDFGDFLFLGSLGIRPGSQHQGIAKRLMTEVLMQAKKEVYLYTIIPEFFTQFGFAVTDTHTHNLPSRDRYECEYCELDKCVIMLHSLQVIAQGR